jgi:hypothetical protein
MIGRHTSLVVWAFLGAAFVAGQVVALVSHGRFPGLLSLITRAAAGRVGRSLLVLAWMWLGWHAFAR